MLDILKVSILILLMLAVVAILVAIYFEKKHFNGGYCPNCGSYMRHFDTDSQGGRGYTCDKCHYHTWVSYCTVDKEYQRSSKGAKQ